VKDTNSKRTRVEPVFSWLEKNGGPDWPRRLLGLAQGFGSVPDPGGVVSCECKKETKVPPSTARLAWMVRNASRLAPQDGKKWRDYERRVSHHPKRDEALAALDQGSRSNLPKSLILEGPSHADCIIECERAVVWIEGKRNDWLSPGTKWDVARDQLARNLEGAWLKAKPAGKEYYLLICHEFPLKHHEEQLVMGYRAVTWNGGWPHLDETQRRGFAHRIGTITWGQFLEAWSPLKALAQLRDVEGRRD
jgi:hypothetical protein